MAQNADVVCFQELKAGLDVIPPECLSPKGYTAFYHPSERPGYSGVGVLTRHPVKDATIGMGDREVDAEGRYIQVDIGKTSFVSFYMPSGSSGEVRQEIKYRFMDKFAAHAAKLKRKKRDFIFCGDFNIAHKEIDLKNWKSNQKNSGFLPGERKWMDQLLCQRAGFIDAFRIVDPRPEQYTWWSNRGQAYAKNVGWRLDYHIVTPALKDRVKKASIYRDVKFSDHAPVTIDYDGEP